MVQVEGMARARSRVMLVLDSAITLAFVFSDQLDEGVAQVFDQAAAEGVLVPQHWRLEVANALALAVHRGRIDSEFRAGALADLSLLCIETDPNTDAHAWTDTLAFAERFRLTLYDAAYLELAHRRNLPLATLYEDLRVAARTASVPLLPA